LLIGNDVVDLRDPESDPRSLHPRFDARVFAPREREQISQSPDPNRERWSLWAAKEAAYKVARKISGETIFSPVRFEVRLGAVSVLRDAEEGWPVRRGTVRHGDHEYELQVFQSADHIHALVNRGLSSGFDVVSGVSRLQSSDRTPTDAAAPGRAARALARRSLAAHSRRDEAVLEIRREGRIPCFFAHGRPLADDLSLSHHGDFVAFVFASPKPSEPESWVPAEAVAPARLGVAG